MIAIILISTWILFCAFVLVFNYKAHLDEPKEAPAASISSTALQPLLNKMKNQKQYDILELQKMSIIELTSIADQVHIEIQNSMKQGLIYAIIDNQYAQRSGKPICSPSELHSRDRYAVAESITKAKTVFIAIVAILLVSSCAMQKPKSHSLRRAVRLNQVEIQYEHSMNAHEDWMRTFRHGWNAPKQMTRIPFTQLYIF